MPSSCSMPTHTLSLMLQEPLSACQGIDELGFLPGWGNTVGRVRESFQMLLDILQVGRGCWGGLGLDVLCLKRRDACLDGWLAAAVHSASGMVWVGEKCGDLKQHEGGLSPLLPFLSPTSRQAPDADTLEKFLARLPLMFKVGWAGGDGHALACICMPACLLVRCCARCTLRHSTPCSGCILTRLCSPSFTLAGGHPVAARLLWPDQRAGHARHWRPGKPYTVHLMHCSTSCCVGLLN